MHGEVTAWLVFACLIFNRGFSDEERNRSFCQHNQFGYLAKDMTVEKQKLKSLILINFGQV